MSWYYDPERKVHVKIRRKASLPTSYRNHFARFGAPESRLKSLPTYEKITSREGSLR